MGQYLRRIKLVAKFAKVRTAWNGVPLGKSRGACASSDSGSIPACGCRSIGSIASHHACRRILVEVSEVCDLKLLGTYLV